MLPTDPHSHPDHPVPESGAEKKRTRERFIAVLPTLLTLGNAACGFGVITFAAKVGPESTEGNHLLVAGTLIFLAMVFDALDGSAARLTKQTSEFGAELDSLCDSISFGVAPAFLMLQFSQAYHSRLLWVIGALYTLCTLLRLARFNVETEDDDDHAGFSGLPSPAAAGTVASFPIAMRGVNELRMAENASLVRLGDALVPMLQITLPFVTLAVAVLMVSRFPYTHVFNNLMRGHKSRRQLAGIVFVCCAIFLMQEFALPLAFGVFAFGPPLRAFWVEKIWSRFRQSKTEPAPEPTDSTDSPLPTSESMEHSFGNGRDLS